MLRHVRAGHPVMFLDEEGGAELVAEKLIALGATPEDAELIRYYPFPARTWNAYDVIVLRELLDNIKPGIVLWDSSAAFLSRAGLDENSAADVTRFWSQVLTPIAREHGAAVLVIDHDTKNGEAVPVRPRLRRQARRLPTSRSRSPSSSRSTAPPTASCACQVTKDRRGWLHRWQRSASRPAAGISRSYSPRPPRTAPSPAGAALNLAPAEQKVLGALTAEPSAVAGITDRIAAAYGHGLTRQTVSGALNKLLRLGAADRLDQGTGKPALWTAANA